MGTIHATVRLTDPLEHVLVKRHQLDPDELKRMNVRMLVDSGSQQLAINEHIQAYFNFPVHGVQKFVTADGRMVSCDIVGPILVDFEGAEANCDAVVLPGDSEPLLGAIPMQSMNVRLMLGEERLAIETVRKGRIF